jgi:hypothetical protein
LAARDGSRQAWSPATGRHGIVAARFAGDPAAVHTSIEL